MIKYKKGMKVRLKRADECDNGIRPITWNISGEMDKYLGMTVVLAKDAYPGLSSVRFKQYNCDDWSFSTRDIAEVISDNTDYTLDDLKVGMFVKLKPFDEINRSVSIGFVSNMDKYAGKLIKVQVINATSFSGDGGYNYHPSWIEKIGFSIGDTVKVVKNSSNGYAEGTICTVTDASPFSFQVIRNGHINPMVHSIWDLEPFIVENTLADSDERSFASEDIMPPPRVRKVVPNSISVSSEHQDLIYVNLL